MEGSAQGLEGSWLRVDRLAVSPALTQDYPRGRSLPDGRLSMREPTSETVLVPEADRLAVTRVPSLGQ